MRGFLDDVARWSRHAAAQRPAPATAAPASAPCLTHHQIVELVAPFVRQGRELDLAASDRAARRLVFKPVPHRPPAAGVDGAPADAGPGGMTETMELSSPRPGFHRLTRRLRLADDAQGALEATLDTDGARPEALLARAQAASLSAPFRFGAGWRLALHQRLHDAQCWPTGAVLQVAGWTLSLRVPGTTARPQVSAAIDLRPDAGPVPDLPDDLLAVLGWDWSALTRSPCGRGWTARLRLRGHGAARGRDALQKLTRAARHLAGTLAEPPHRFHDRLVAARRSVWLRRSIPWVAAGLMALEAVFAGSMKEARDSPVVVALLLLPVLLMALFLWRSEQPRLEWPPWPRRLPGRRWGGG